MAGRSAMKLDVDAITETIQRALSAAGLDTRSGRMKGVTETISQALTAAGLIQRGESAARGSTIDRTADEVTASLPAVVSSIRPPFVDADDAAVAPLPDIGVARPGQFSSHSFANAAGTRTYKLYIPARHVD